MVAIIALILGAVALAVGIAAFMAWLVMLLWNGVIAGGIWPTGPEITFWMAWGMMIIFNILFGGSLRFGSKS